MGESGAALPQPAIEEMTREARVKIEGRRSDSTDDTMIIQDIRAGLGAPPRTIPSTYLYDDRGSQLFEEITVLEEYYQTRTEEGLLARIAEEVIELAKPRELFELGSGAGRKIRMLLDAMEGVGRLDRCTLLDINQTFLTSSALRLAESYAGLEVRGVVGDFTRDLDAVGNAENRLAVFFAGTFGNLEPPVAPGFLAAMGRTLGRNGWILVGLDLVKDPAVLERAYNDAAGVTAEFNLNVLRVLNTRLGADFDLGAFDHVALYDHENAWIEMRLRANRSVRARIPAAGIEFDLAAGEEIRTEISRKFTARSFARELDGTGLTLRRWFTDLDHRFALALVSGPGPTAVTS